MRIRIDSERCVGAAQCVLTAPGVFAQRGDGLGEVIPDGMDPQVQEAVWTCPSQAIEVISEQEDQS
jgi:ferredoxin